MKFIIKSKFVFWYVWRHPANSNGRLAAIGRLVYWQIRKRLLSGGMNVDILGKRIFRILPDSKFSSLVYYTKYPDWEEMNFLIKVLRPTDGFLDIGANVGFYTVLASAIVEPKNIWAAEAHPSNLEALKQQLLLNKISVNILPYALSNVSGSVIFSAPDRETGSVVDTECFGSFTVRAKRLDDLLDHSKIPRIMFVKMDVEGGELDVLAGALGLINEGAFPVWIFELSAPNLARRGSKREALLKIFTDNDYRFYSWSSDLSVLNKIDPLSSPLQNIIACRGGVDWLMQRVAPLVNQKIL